MNNNKKLIGILAIIMTVLILILAGLIKNDERPVKTQSGYTQRVAMNTVTPSPTMGSIYIYATPTPLGYDAYSYSDPVQTEDYTDPYTEEQSYSPAEPIVSDYQPADTPTPFPSPAPVYTGSSEIKVYFINVGQGDATLIIDNGSAMMIDTGPREAAGTIEAVLNENGISRIDTMVLTHPDADHIQGAITLIKDYTIGAIYMPDYSKDTGTYAYLMDMIYKYNVPVYRPEAGAYIPFGTASYQILGPILGAIPYYEEERDLANFYSIVVKLTNGADSFLFMGDAPGAETDAILNAGFDVSAKVFKAAHHGSANEGCNNDALWRAVNPEAVVISCGLYNDHGHPHEEVMNEAMKRGCKLFRTDLQGTISCVSTGNGIIWNMEPSGDYRNGRSIY